MATLKAELTQRDAEKFEAAYNEYGIDEIAGLSRINGKVLEAAIEAGWITDLKTADIADMKAADVRKLGRKVMQLYGSLNELDPLA